MINKKPSNVIRLSDEASVGLGEMLKILTSTGAILKINHSKLLSFIMLDYKERYFEKNQEKIILHHLDKRKDAQDKLVTLSDEDLEAVVKFLSKIKKDASQSHD